MRRFMPSKPCSAISRVAARFMSRTVRSGVLPAMRAMRASVCVRGARDRKRGSIGNAHMNAEEAGRVDVGRDGAVATVTLVRPAKHNAVTPELDAAMAAAFAQLARDDGVRAVVITGAGPDAFCTGADIPTLLPVLRRRMEGGDDPVNFCGLTHVHPLPGKPIVAAVNGLALGGGFELALASDLRIASTRARFGLPEPRLGLIAAAGGCARVLHALPPAVAAEVLLAGRRLDAEEALRWGLVSRVVAPEA